jgi:hypothetical protein
MRKKILVMLVICLLAGFGAFENWRSAPPPAPALIDTSMLRPGMTCKIGVDSPTAAFANCARAFLGMVSEVSETEIVLDDAVYQVVGDTDTDIHMEVGTVSIPVTEVAWIHLSGEAPLADGTLAERIGIQFR